MQVRMNRVLVSIAGVLAASAAVLGAPPDPPDMGSVAFPISLSSIAAAVGIAGGLLLLGYFGVRVGFGVAKGLMSRALFAVAERREDQRRYGMSQKQYAAMDLKRRSAPGYNGW